MQGNSQHVDLEAWLIVFIVLLPGVVAILYSIVSPDYGHVEKLAFSISLLSFIAAFFCINQFWDDLLGKSKQAGARRKK